MRDVTRKIDTLRTATATSALRVGATGMQHLKAGTLPKGDPFGISLAAGLLAAKKTSELIPHCHNLPLDSCDIAFETTDSGVTITATARTVWKTGVEMEALTAASIAALTLYDLLKPVEEELAIVATQLTEKRGGESQFTAFFQDVKPRFAILIASDRASEGTYEDISGQKIREIVTAEGGIEAGYALLPDEQMQLETQLMEWCAAGNIDFIFTSGGTGIAPRDVMVEATKDVIDRELPGIAEAMRSYSQRRKPLAMFTRGTVGTRGKTMIINLPGSPKGVEECLEAILPYIFHAVGELSKSAVKAAGSNGTTQEHFVAATPAPAPTPAQDGPRPTPRPQTAVLTDSDDIPLSNNRHLTNPMLRATPVMTGSVQVQAPKAEELGDRHTTATPSLGFNPGTGEVTGTPQVGSMTPKFDPVTGEPITATPTGIPTPRFDPATGMPLDATPAAIPSPVIPPVGNQVTPSGGHHSLDPGWRGTLYSPSVTPVSTPSVPQFDPETGEPINYVPTEETPKDDTSMFQLPN